MQNKDGKRLVMVGIRRKGEKGFKTRIGKDLETPLPDVVLPGRKVVQKPRKESGLP